MQNIKEKIKLYKEKRKLLKKENEIFENMAAQEFLSLPEDLQNSYASLYNTKELVKIIEILSLIDSVICTGGLGISIANDSDLRYDISNMLTSGIDQVIYDLKAPLYVSFISTAVIMYILYSRTYEYGKELDICKMNFEYEEPKLKGYKYVKE